MHCQHSIRIDEYSADTELDGIQENAPIMAMLREIIRVCHRRGVTLINAFYPDEIYVAVKGAGSFERSKLINNELQAIMVKFHAKYLSLIDHGYERQQEQITQQFLGEF